MSNEAYVDGNAAAGVLREIFAVDLTAAIGRCVGCGAHAPLGAAHTYLDSPGLVLRCGGCQAVLVKVVTGSGRTWLDLRGLLVLEVVSGDNDPGG